MIDNTEKYNEENIVEAILFMMGDTVSCETLSMAIKKDEAYTKELADGLVEKYQNEYADRGMKIIRINNKYQMVANNKYFENLVVVASNPKKPILTDSILETLSIIAYKQPITKPEIEDIRGVKSDFQCNKLIEYGLVEEKGRLETAGRPIILGTTEEFLRRFGLETIEKLPTLDHIKETEIQNEVYEEVSKTLGETVFNDNKEEDNSSEINKENDVNNKYNTQINNNENINFDENNDISDSTNV